jgi:hypothetical protein
MKEKDKEKFLRALQINEGSVSQSARDTNISRKTHYRWLKEDKEYSYEVELIRDGIVDLAEGALIERIKKGDTTAITYALNKLGKSRGYASDNKLIGTNLKVVIDQTEDDFSDIEE